MFFKIYHATHGESYFPYSAIKNNVGFTMAAGASCHKEARMERRLEANKGKAFSWKIFRRIIVENEGIINMRKFCLLVLFEIHCCKNMFIADKKLAKLH